MSDDNELQWTQSSDNCIEPVHTLSHWNTCVADDATDTKQHSVLTAGLHREYKLKNTGIQVSLETVTD